MSAQVASSGCSSWCSRLGTWLMRSLPIMLHGHVPHPPWLERLLKHVPVAALTALVVPGALYVHAGSTYTLAPARIDRRRCSRCSSRCAPRTSSRRSSWGWPCCWLAQWALSAIA